jgi:alpha-beta hydrolase superfamily lysophospholipase
MEPSLRLLPAGLENNVRMQQALAPVRETRTERQPAASPSTQVSISAAARAAASSDIPIARPTETGPAVPVQVPVAVAQAGGTDAAPNVANQDAVQRYLQSARNDLLVGQGVPSMVRVSA